MELTSRIDIDAEEQVRLRDLALAAICMNDLDHRKSFPLTYQSHQIETIAFTRDYQYFVQYLPQELRICDSSDGVSKYQIPYDAAYPLACWFSPDGKRVAVVGEYLESDGTEATGLWVFDIQSGREIVHLDYSTMQAAVQRLAVDFNNRSDMMAIGLDDQRAEHRGHEPFTPQHREQQHPSGTESEHRGHEPLNN